MKQRNVAVYRELGALGAATHYRHCFGVLDGYEYIGRLTEAEARAVPLVEIPDPNWPVPGRWECCKCGGRHVQVTLPFWYRELSPENPDEYRVGSLQPVGVDEDADPMWWYCEDCEETGSGRPMEADEPEPPDPRDLCAHDWNYTGTQYGGDDERFHGEGRVICRKCGADGDG